MKSEIQGTALMRGYCGLWHSLKTNYGIIVNKDIAMNILKEMIQRELTCENPIAYAEESTYLKNQIPVADGYDKLKPYGFPIHGCIDEYSRRVLWLKMTK